MSQQFPIPRTLRGPLIYVATAGQREFPFPFYLVHAEDVEVRLKAPGALGYAPAPLTAEAQYTATGLGTTNGATIVLNTGVAAGTNVMLTGRRLAQRESSVVQGGSVRAIPLEEELDLLTTTQQELYRDIRAAETVLADYGNRILTSEFVSAEADRAEGAVAAAQAAALAAQAILQLLSPQTAFSDRETAQAALINGQLKLIRVNSYYAASPGLGGGLYKRVASAPTIALSGFRSADRFLPNGTVDAANGGWWQLCMPDAGFVTPEMLGAPAVPSMVAPYDTPFIQAAIDFSRGRVLFSSNPDRAYYLNAELTCPYYAAVLKAGGANLGCWLHVIGSYGRTLTLGADGVSCGSPRVQGLRFWRDAGGHFLKQSTAMNLLVRGTNTVIGSPAHGLVPGDKVLISGSGTQADGYWTVKPGTTTNAFGIYQPGTATEVDSSAWTAWTSGGAIYKVQNGIDDTVVAIDNPVTYGNSWHLRLYYPTFAVVEDCSFTGHGRQLWVDQGSYIQVKHCDFNGYWDQYRPGLQECEANIWFSSVAQEEKTINGVTQAAAATVTIPGHGYANGDRVYLYGITTGPTALNNRTFRVADAVGNAFNLKDAVTGAYINTSAMPAWVAGGAVRRLNEGALNNALQTKAFIFDCVLEGVGIPTEVAGQNTQVPRLITIGNASRIQRENIGSKYGIAAFNAEGLTIQNNILGAHNHSSIYVEPRPFGLPGSSLNGHISITDNFMDGDIKASLFMVAGDALMYSVQFQGNHCNGGDIADHVVRIEAGPRAGPTVTRLEISGNTSQGHRKAPIFLQGVNCGTINGNVLGGWNVLEQTSDLVDVTSGIYVGTSCTNLTVFGNVLGGGVNDPAGPFFGKWGVYFAAGVIGTHKQFGNRFVPGGSGTIAGGGDCNVAVQL